MLKQKQLIKHRPDEGIYGDCHRTAIACLLHMKPEDVPNFGEHYTDGYKFVESVEAWLATQGLASVSIAFSPPNMKDVLLTQKSCNPDTYYLLGGESAIGAGHTVIGCNDEIVWDPSNEENGIVGPMSDGFYWVTYLVPLILKRMAGEDSGLNGSQRCH